MAAPTPPSEAQQQAQPLTAFVNFPSPYTQSLLLSALTSIPSIAITLLPPSDDAPPRLQWADYDLMTFDRAYADASLLISSYVYRKALIRKHQLHATVAEYLAKASHRGEKSVLAIPGDGGAGGVPRGWIVDVQFADELDELLMDDLYELADEMAANEGKDEADKTWFILKPGFADRAQGIRMFSTEEELRDIFEEFEPPSDDEDEDDDDDDDDEDEDEDTTLAAKTAATRISGASSDSDEHVHAGAGAGTAVMTSHLRHFVIQEYLPRPVLFDVGNGPAKFHLRAYVLLVGGYKVHISRTLLALFSGTPYAPPTGDPADLAAHLTNTCAQTDAFGAPVPDEGLVRYFWDLAGETAHGTDGRRGVVDDQWLDTVFRKSGEVVAEAVRAGAECGSFGLQLMENAFEIFGVDLMLTFPPTPTSTGTLPVPSVTLLEFNASPDFHQSGAELRPRLLEMFRGVVEIVIKPFFGIDDEEQEGEKEAAMEVGDERRTWVCVGAGRVRGPTA